jgi:tRNA/rRNA methyltransferase
MPQLRIVLVEPREGGNVGAVARAMKNFGRSSLWLVGALPQMHPVAEWWASGAGDVVQGAVIVSALEEALADAHLTVATTSSRGRTIAPPLTPAGVAEMFSSFRDDQTLAVVFGREDRGLTVEEAALCQRTAVIPTSPEFPTMNLAQSVAVFCYELSRTEMAQPVNRDLAPAALIERLHRQAAELLRDVGFLRDPRLYDEMRSLAGRAMLTEREVTLLLGIIRQIEWQLRQSGGKQE